MRMKHPVAPRAAGCFIFRPNGRIVRIHSTGARMNRLRLVMCIAICVACGASAGCNSEVPDGGYLDETSKLRATPDSEGTYVHFEDSLAAYDRFTVAPLTF